MSAQRPVTAPDFLLSRAHGSIRTQGAVEVFDNPEDAIRALKSRKAELVVGALPFRRDHKAALTVPRSVIREEGPLEPHAYYRQGEGSRLTARLKALDPSLEQHRHRVQAAIDTIRNQPLDKVVLARAVDVEFDEPVDPRLIAARLIDLSYARDGFIADLTPAGEDFVGAMLVGSSPEVLIKKQGSTVSAFPLAGSAPRSADPVQDRANRESLHTSIKDHEEHAYVVDHLRRLLAPLCTRLEIPAQPELISTNEMWHLATPIAGTLKDPGLSALELATIVHPTPAICGTPTHAAEELISFAESDRRFYAGAVGWCDATGDGEYMVAIRCAEVAGDGRTARAWAGGGLIADSVAEEEVAETTAKLRTIMRALGIS